ncbi:MAG TPA: GatB/YqeY domain-containing protein [Gemmatimonadaceae bacterium]|nr:GatB/YqeY domain-containing protein [Gemmatimonadaceae bacterium]
MSQLQARLEGDLVAARKAQDKQRVLLLGTVLSEIKNRRIELQRQPTDQEVVEVLQRGIKKRRESIEMYTKGAREDLAGKERSEVEALEAYLPEQVSDDELRAAVRAAIDGGAAQMGAVMGKVAPGFKGRAEGSRINAIAREELAKQG